MGLFDKFLGKKKQAPQAPAQTPPWDIPTQIMETEPPIALPEGFSISLAQELGTRDYQQDRCRLSNVRGQLAAIICDGMGGIEGGAEAASVAVKTWIELYEQGFADFPEFAERSVAAMDRKIRDCQGAGGSTAAAVWIDGENLRWMSIGDSKIYIFRNGSLACATREHNYQLVLDARLKRGEISQAEYDQGLKDGAALVSFIGKGQTPLLDVSQGPFRLRPGDVVLICSDGLYKSLPEPKIEKVLASYSGDFGTIVPYLVDLAARTCAVRDNTTAVAIRYNGMPREDA